MAKKTTTTTATVNPTPSYLPLPESAYQKPTGKLSSNAKYLIRENELILGFKPNNADAKGNGARMFDGIVPSNYGDLCISVKFYGIMDFVYNVGNIATDQHGNVAIRVSLDSEAVASGSGKNITVFSHRQFIRGSKKSDESAYYVDCNIYRKPVNAPEKKMCELRLANPILRQNGKQAITQTPPPTKVYVPPMVIETPVIQTTVIQTQPVPTPVSTQPTKSNALYELQQVFELAKAYGVDPKEAMDLYKSLSGL